VFKGYFAQAKATAETIDSEGWAHTGDIGVIQPNGTVKIIDRKKNIFKLSQGEYIVPDKLENKLIQSPLIAQIFVYGDSLQNNLVAVVVPEKPILEKWAAENSVSGSYEEILASPQVNKLYLEDIKKQSKDAGFFGFETPLKIHITSTVFSIDNDLLTPTFKLKRNEAKKFFFN
jgi:long-chain acyl-CoA synthetase